LPTAAELPDSSEGDKPYWMPEISLGIGVEPGSYANRQREWLYWYDDNGFRYPTPTEKAEIAEQKTHLLMERLREMGIDPERMFEKSILLSRNPRDPP
jgi:hypothetical protein